MNQYTEDESEVNMRLIKIHIGIHEPEFLERYEKAKRTTGDFADSLRVEEVLVNKTQELREKGYIPSNEDLETDVRKIAALHGNQREEALSSYKEGLKEYEGQLKRWADK